MISGSVLRAQIDGEIVKNNPGYGLRTNFQQVLPKEGGALFVTMSGEEVWLDVAVLNSKARLQLVQEFKKALLMLDAEKMKQLLYKNDFETPFIVYTSVEDGYIIRKGAYSVQEFLYRNPLPTLIKSYIQRNGPMRFDDYFSVSQYFPALGAYQKLRHFENYYNSASSLKDNTDYSIGMASYILMHAKDEKKIKLIEIGAGTGENLYRVLTALKTVTQMKIETYIVEISETLKLTQKHKLKAFDVKWVGTLEQIPSNHTLTFMMLEGVLVSFPQRVFKKIGHHYHELYMTQEGYAFLHEGITQDHSLIADIQDVTDWPDGSLIYRSQAAEEFLRKALTYFKRFVLLACDHTIPHMTSFSLYDRPGFYTACHLVGKNGEKIDLNKNAGEFMMAFSLYQPVYDMILKSMDGIRYQTSYAKDFFKNIGGFRVYQDYAQFKMFVVWRK